jgi:hypothetical protein
MADGDASFPFAVRGCQVSDRPWQADGSARDLRRPDEARRGGIEFLASVAPQTRQPAAHAVGHLSQIDASAACERLGGWLFSPEGFVDLDEALRLADPEIAQDARLDTGTLHAGLVTLPPCLYSPGAIEQAIDDREMGVMHPDCCRIARRRRCFPCHAMSSCVGVEVIYRTAGADCL